MSEQNVSRRSALSDSVFASLVLIGLGIIWWQGWWWPGVLTVFGVAGGLAGIVRGNYLLAACLLVILAVLPQVYYQWPGYQVPWSVFGPLALIALGVVTLLSGIGQVLRRK